jgi:hypothetical protein
MLFVLFCSRFRSYSFHYWISFEQYLTSKCSTALDSNCAHSNPAPSCDCSCNIRSMTACSSLQSSQSQTPSLTREAKIVLMGFIPLERRLLPLFSTDRHPYVGTPTRILLQAAVRNSSCPSKNQTYKFRVSRKG